MQVYLRISLYQDASYQDAMEVFDKLERCTILDIDLETIKNRLKYNVKMMDLFFPNKVFSRMNVAECRDTVARYMCTFYDILYHYPCVNLKRTFMGLNPDKGSKEVVELCERVTKTAFEQVQVIQGKPLLSIVNNAK